MANMKTNVKQPASPEFLDQSLIPLDAFREKMRAVTSVPKSELDEHIKNNPDAPQKRSRKLKNDN